MAAMKDPKIAQMLGQNPMAQQIQAAAMAHLNEHLAFEYRKQIEAQLGLPLPTEEETENMPVEVAAKVAQMAAQAAQRLLQKNQSEAQQLQAQQQMQDPVIQMQMQEMQLKAKEGELKEKKLAADTAAEADRLEIERERIAAQERIAGAQIGAKVQGEKAKRESSEQIEGVRMGMQAAQARDNARRQTQQTKEQ
jgi:hypothetical protein